MGTIRSMKPLIAFYLIVAGIGGITALLLALHHTAPNQSAHIAQSATCTDRTLLITAAEEKGFSRFVDGPLSVYPYKGLPAAAPTYARDYEGGHFMGYLNNRALSPPFRAEEDAFARSLGYSVGKWPLVPLSGPIVSSTPGLLEVYQWVYFFKAPADSAAWITDTVTTLKATPSVAAIVGESLPKASAVFSRMFGPNDGQHERGLTYVDRAGRVGSILEFQGGANLVPAQVASTVSTAFHKLQGACSEGLARLG